MQRFCFLAVLMLLGSSAHADGFSFSIGGRRIHIEASRYCRSTSCASISVSGLYQSRRRSGGYDDDFDDRAEPARPPMPPQQTVSPVPAAAPANVAVAPPPVAALPAQLRPAASATQIVAAPSPSPSPSPPAPRPVQPAAIVAPPPPAAPRVEQTAEAVRPAPAATPRISNVSHEVDDDPADTPIGDWQTEGKGTVRIAQCGRALCGYVLNGSSDTKGEAVLVNMKPKTDTQWSGSVYSQASGDTYYGTIDIRGPNTLRVEACALGRFYCSGNNWSRIDARAARLVTSRQTLAEPRS